MRKNILEPVILAGLLLSAFLSWYVLFRAVMVPGSSTWGAPIAIFFILLVFFFLCAVLVRRPAYLGAVLAASLLLSLVFAATPLHFVLLLLSAGIAFWAVRSIRESLNFSIRIRFFNSLLSGRGYVVLALIIAITSQYYALVNRARGEVNLPTFEISRTAALYLGKLYGHINPDYSFFSSAREMTVDKFIMQNQAPGREAAAIKPVLERGRKQLSVLSGRQLGGGEQMADVFVDLVTRKINDYFAVGMAQSGKASAIPLFLTCVLFLTLLPVATIVSYAGTLFSAVLCGVLLKKGFIKKESKQVQAESLLL